MVQARFVCGFGVVMNARSSLPVYNSAHTVRASGDKPPQFFIPGCAPEEQDKLYAPWPEVATCMGPAEANGFTRSAIATMATRSLPQARRRQVAVQS
jgi:hypothetical protein